MKNGIMSLAMVCTLALFAACNKDDDNSTKVSSTDASFTTMAAMSNYAETSAAQLALTKSSDADVIAFANRMISDHGHAQDSLQLIASQLKLSAPDSVNAEQKAVGDTLKTLSGRAFDSVYIHSEVDGHVKTIALLNNETATGTNSRLKKYVTTYLPAIEMHLTMAQTMVTKYPR